MVVSERGRLTISRPTALIVVSDDIVVRRVGVSTQVALDEVPRLISREAEENVQAINITGVQADGVTSLCSANTS
jgi:hypothetical protein